MPELLAELARCDAQLAVAGVNLRVDLPVGTLTTQLHQAISAHKQAILVHLSCLPPIGEGPPNGGIVDRETPVGTQFRAATMEPTTAATGPSDGRSDLPAALGDWPADWLDSFIERAAIMEFDGGLPRPEAERRAAELVRKEHQAHREQAACPSLPASVADSPSRER